MRCRFLVSDASDVSRLEKLDWDDVVLVEVSTASSERVSTCPITLDSIQIPYITPCGHQFSLISIVGHILSRNGGELKGSAACPLCFSDVVAKDLRPVQIRELVYTNVQEGDHVEFTLLSRKKNSYFVNYSPLDKIGDPRMEPGSYYPVSLDTFSRVSVVKNPENLWKYILTLLARGCEKTRSEGGNEANVVLPSYLAAIELVIQLGTLWTQHRLHSLLAKEKIIAEDYTSVVDGTISRLRQVVEKVVQSAHTEELDRLRQMKLDSEFPMLSAVTASTRVWEQELKMVDFQVDVTHLESEVGTSEDSYFFYQVSDGQWIFLSMFMMKIFARWKGGYEELPHMIRGQVVEVEELIQTEDTKRRIKVLSHVPMNASIKICELDITTIVPEDIVAMFANELQQKNDRRLQLAKRKAQKLKQEERAASAARPIEIKPPTAEEMAAMPRLGSSYSDDDDRSSVGTPISSSMSFARIAKLGFAATGPALGESPPIPRPNSVWNVSGSSPPSRTSVQETIGGTGSKKSKRLLLSTSKRQY